MTKNNQSRDHEKLSEYEGKILRFKTKIGFLADAEVILAPDPDGPSNRPLLCQLIGPAPPEDQPQRESPYGAESYEPHAKQWANSEMLFNHDLVNLPVPTGDRTQVVSKNDVWEEGKYDVKGPSETL